MSTSGLFFVSFFPCVMFSNPYSKPALYSSSEYEYMNPDILI